MATADGADWFALDNTSFPSRPACFGFDPTNSSCVVPSQSMIDFLNITNPSLYRQVYCLNPPDDSCAFGYCPNPDIASPAVRISTYIGTICLAFLLLYKPEAASESFYCLALQNYSLMIAAIISIAWNQLTRLHAVFALIVTGSPVSVYLVFQTMRSIFFKCDVRLEPIFGKSIGYRGILNRAISILAIPFWVFIFATVVRPGSNWFTQSACDRAALSDPGFHYSKDDFYDGSVAIFVGITVAFWLFALPFAGLFCLWVIIACFIKRKKIRNRPADANYFQGAWRVISEDYPFTRFALLILLPFTNWVLSLEMGSNFSNEEFTPSVGQLLVVSAAIPAFLQCTTLLKRLFWWFADLCWVRLLTCRLNSPRHEQQVEDGLGPYKALHGRNATVDSKISYGNESGHLSGLPMQHLPPEQARYSTVDGKMGFQAYDPSVPVYPVRDPYSGR